MGKNSLRFVCGTCGFEAPKWLGKCPGCHSWNTMIEEPLVRIKAVDRRASTEATPLSSISSHDITRFSSGINELDRVLGGGIVPGSLVLLGGDPGVGKSTLLLQVADHIASSGQRVLYLSGEESLKQIRLRSLRLGLNGELVYLLNEPDIDVLDQHLAQVNPGLVIIDSIQTVFSSAVSSIPGSVTQLRECTLKIAELAKGQERAVFLVGHVTKDGALAGPKTLEHMVDAVVYFEGEKELSLRVLRGVKNRFGSTDEIGLLEMSSQGLLEVPDPSGIFISSRGLHGPGTAITTCFEGSRAFLLEVQALVAPAGPGYARRMAAGVDQSRLALIVAVLEKRCGLRLSSYDIYLKVTGGVFIKDPAVDLGIAAAILSSYSEKPLPGDAVFLGEVSLSGMLRPVHSLEARLKEAEKMGYSQVVLPPLAKRLDMESKLTFRIMDSIDKLLEFTEG
ncbi:MAG TPA: DNA repair protein RadA [Syntrophomonadaceae bacterium]|nr:DNA repair protein RadA [Syntrophomonadaceae bacterium]